jgi:hypothetical protein
MESGDGLGGPGEQPPRRDGEPGRPPPEFYPPKPCTGPCEVETFYPPAGDEPEKKETAAAPTAAEIQAFAAKVLLLALADHEKELPPKCEMPGCHCANMKTTINVNADVADTFIVVTETIDLGPLGSKTFGPYKVWGSPYIAVQVHIKTTGVCRRSAGLRVLPTILGG